MDKLALVLSIAALALGGWFALGGGPAATDGGLEDDDGADARLAALETRMAAIEAARDTEYVSVAGSAPTGDAGLEGRAGTVPSRIAALEERLAAMDDRVETVEKKADEDPMASANNAVRRWTNKRFFHNTEAAAQALDLDDAQKRDLERIVESTGDRLDELYTTANDDGMTWKEAGKIELKGMDEGAIISLMGNRKKLEKFKRTTVPGTNETYGDAEARIKGQGKDEARGLLTPAQQETWDGAHTDHMFGGGVGGGAVSFAFSDAVVAPVEGK